MPWPTAGRIVLLKGGGGRTVKGTGTDHVSPYVKKVQQNYR